MNGALKYSSIKTETLIFKAYRKFAVRLLIERHGISLQKARTLSQNKGSPMKTMTNKNRNSSEGALMV